MVRDLGRQRGKTIIKPLQIKYNKQKRNKRKDMKRRVSQDHITVIREVEAGNWGRATIESAFDPP
jgi:hypothetical protein